MIDKMITYMIDNHEGGFVDHPYDRGGATNYGISQRVYERWLGREVSKEEMRNMPKDHAVAIYREEYFIQPKIQLLPVQLQHVTFDMSVNHGQRNGVKLLQRGLQRFPEGEGIDTDGRIGPQTVRIAAKAIERHGVEKVLAAIVAERLEFYDSIIARDPKQEVFAGGWTKRAKDFLVADLISTPRKEEKVAGKISNKNWRKA